MSQAVFVSFRYCKIATKSLIALTTNDQSVGVD